MNDFVALLLASAIFCAAFVALGLATRLVLHHGLGPAGLAEGSALQYALALAGGAVAYRRAMRPA